jgi:hypothetical protein
MASTVSPEQSLYDLASGVMIWQPGMNCWQLQLQVYLHTLLCTNPAACAAQGGLKMHMRLYPPNVLRMAQGISVRRSTPADVTNMKRFSDLGQALSRL